MLKSNSKFYYSCLDNPAKRIYENVLSALESHNPNPSFMVNPFNHKPDIQKILQYIDYDNPNLFYVNFKKIRFLTSPAKISLQFNFLYSKQKINAMKKQLESNIAKILSFPKFASMDTYNKELLLHDNLVKNISYSKTGTNTETTSIIGALISNCAVCEGYARAFKLLCDHAGLPAIIVPGTATPTTRQKEPHEKNIVKLNGTYTHVDVTWDSTIRDKNGTCYDYFNLTDNDIAKDHTWDKSLLPACISDTNNYFIKNGLCISNRSEFKNYIAERAKRGEKTITFRLTGPEKTTKQVMNAAQEALQSTLKHGYSISLRYNNKHGIGSISLLS